MSTPMQPVASTSTAHLAHTPSSIRLRHDGVQDTPRYSTTSSGRPPVRRRGSKGKEKARMETFAERIRRMGGKGFVKEAFRMFGEHCARNQIRTLLIDCLVMTNLFYPALSIYLQKRFPPLHPPSPPSHDSHRTHWYSINGGHSQRQRKEHPLSLLSTPVLDSFFPYPPPLLPRLTWSGWWGRDTGQSSDHVDEWLATRVTPDQTWMHQDEEGIRLVRIAWAGVSDVLDMDLEEEMRAWHERDFEILDLVRNMVEDWDRQEDGHRGSCIRHLGAVGDDIQQTGPCYIISSHGQPELAGGPITPLSALHREDQGQELHATGDLPSNWIPDAGKIYRTIAVPFRVPHNGSDHFDQQLSENLERAAARVDGELFVEAMRPQLKATEQTEEWMLSYRPTIPSSDRPRAPAQASLSDTSTPKSVIVLYLVLFSILGAQLSDATKVHSRFGLAFTGIVQLCCSAVMSFSVLALLGWNGWGWGRAVSQSDQASLPSYILPFVIVVVGAENMSTLTKAVFSVPFTYSVPVRIGLGLSKVGRNIAITSLTDLALLMSFWFMVPVRPVREFCLFAAVVIITDWFMLHTFFLTVLSIDAQRLELADVLNSDGSRSAATLRPKVEDEPPVNRSWFSWKRLVQTRRSKMGSLALIVLSVGVIYYLTEKRRLPLSTPNLYGYVPTSTTHLPSSPIDTTTLASLPSLSEAERFWRCLNPLGAASLRVTIPPGSIFVLPTFGHQMRPADLRKLSLPASRLILPRLKPLFYVFKVVVLPQAVTALTLYIILLFLLKDRELLDAQRNKLGRNEEPADDEVDSLTGSKGSHILDHVHINMLPCSHETDIELISSSEDGRILLSVGVENSLCLWRLDEVRNTGTRETIQVVDEGSSMVPIVASCVNKTGTMIAVGSQEGVIQQWETTGDGQPTPILGTTLPNSPRIRKLRYTPAQKDDHDPFISRPSSPLSTTHNELLVIHVDGSTTSILPDGSLRSQPSSGATNEVKVFELEGSGGTPELLVSSPYNQALHLLSRPSELPIELQSGAAARDRVTSATTLNDVIALGHMSGLIELFDYTGALLATVGRLGSGSESGLNHGASSEGIRKLRLAQPAASFCTGCRSTTNHGMIVISSTTDRVYVDRICVRGSVSCRCARRGSSIEEIRPKANNALVAPPVHRTRLTPGSSPKRSPSLLPPISNGEFPLSSHGTRRMSALHKEGSGSSDTPSMTTMSPVTALGGTTNLGVNGIDGTDHPPELEVFSLGFVQVPGCGTTWDVVGNTVLGLKRDRRTRDVSKSLNGTDDSQWSVWAIDLTRPWNGNNLVVDLQPLVALIDTSPVRPVNGEDVGSLRNQRKERLMSLNGKSVFPSSISSGSTSTTTFRPLAYVDIRPFKVIAEPTKGSKSGGGIVAGFGNRLGIINIPSRASVEEAGMSVGVNPPRASGSGSNFASQLSGIGSRFTPPPPSRTSLDGLSSKKML